MLTKIGLCGPLMLYFMAIAGTTQPPYSCKTGQSIILIDTSQSNPLTIAQIDQLNFKFRDICCDNLTIAFDDILMTRNSTIRLVQDLYPDGPGPPYRSVVETAVSVEGRITLKFEQKCGTVATYIVQSVDSSSLVPMILDWYTFTVNCTPIPCGGN